MTTKSSPIQVLKAQADKAARVVKESGLDKCKFAMVMDDKIITIDMADVRSIPEKTLAKHILDLMQEAP